MAALRSVVRISFGVLATISTVAVVLPAPASTQSAKKSTIPMTPWGKPDLQGRWTNQTFTPLERPARFGGREFLTDDEALELTRRLTADGVDPLAGGSLFRQGVQGNGRTVQSDEGPSGSIHYDNAIWLTEPQKKSLTSRRTSLIVDPPNGRLPPLTPAAQKREAARARAMELAQDGGPLLSDIFDGVETRPLSERCLLWPHEGPPLLPASYNSNYQISQTPEHVVILQEMIHNVRVIPLDGRPQLSPNLLQWGGSSRGHWEDATLVVETTNFRDFARFYNIGPLPMPTPATRLVERFTRVDADTIRYAFTIEDPERWTRPWTAEIPMVRIEGLLYEYACHEGNHGLENILRTARLQEKAAK